MFLDIILMFLYSTFIPECCLFNFLTAANQLHLAGVTSLSDGCSSRDTAATLECSTSTFTLPCSSSFGQSVEVVWYCSWTPGITLKPKIYMTKSTFIVMRKDYLDIYTLL